MIGNYLIVAFRNLVRHKLYSFINIAGLTVGLTCAIFIILFVRDQLSYDRWIPGTENLYRLEMRINSPGKPSMPSAMTPFIAAQAALDNIPEVQARARLVRHAATILVGNRQFPQNVDFVDPNFLEMIRLPLAAGDPASVFSRPESAVISQAAARRYFGGDPAVGKTGGICRITPSLMWTCLSQTYRLLFQSIGRRRQTGSGSTAGVMSAWRQEPIRRR